MTTLISMTFDHVWQSTLFGLAAAFLAWTLRENPARIRFRIWMIASIKFLIPFAAFAELGSRLPVPASIALPAQIAMPRVIETAVVPAVAMARPYSQPGIHEPGYGAAWAAGIAAVWMAGSILVIANWWRQWRRIHKAYRVSRLACTRRGMQIRVSAAASEPGAFGVWQPVLLIPEGMQESMTEEQFEAIVEHEYCHVQRRDNFFALAHLVVEAAFWFHPFVHWAGRRLLIERERACDEDVLRRGFASEIYAESILSVSRFCLRPPVAGMAGASGVTLKERIRGIMNSQSICELTLARKAAVAAAGIAAVLLPVLSGAANPALFAQTQRALDASFEAATVKPNRTGDARSARIQFQAGGRFTAVNVPLQVLVAIAYQVPFQSPRLIGGPDWVKTDNWDVQGTANSASFPEGASGDERGEISRGMLRTLLADRFHLVIRREIKEMPAYVAVVGKNGPKLEKSRVTEAQCAGEVPPDGVNCHSIIGGMGRGLHGQAATAADIVRFVQNWTDRPVVDETGLKGLYNVQTEGWAPMVPMSPDHSGSQEAKALADPSRPTLFMIFENLGLKLEARKKVAVEMLIIESAQKPGEN